MGEIILPYAARADATPVHDEHAVVVEHANHVEVVDDLPRMMPRWNPLNNLLHPDIDDGQLIDAVQSNKCKMTFLIERDSEGVKIP